MNRVIVTGGSGFVGSNLVRELSLLSSDMEILVIDDFRSGHFSNLCCEKRKISYRGELISSPLHEMHDLYDVIADFEPEVIFHLASITDTTVTDQAKMIRDNVEPFHVLLNLAIEQGIKLVWASSAAVYGIRANGAAVQKRPFKLSDAGEPANVYGFSKWVMENLARKAMAESAEAHIVGLRYFNVFGPGEHHKGKMASMVYQLTKQILGGHRPRIFHDGSQSRDQIYVDDVVSATLAASKDDAVSGIYNVGTGKPTSFNQVIDAINTALETNLQPDYFENPYAFYQNYTCADISQTTKGLKWSPRHSPEQAIQEYARWLKTTGF